jgi:hypothetical protein
MSTHVPLRGLFAALILTALAVMLASCERTEEDTSQAATEGPDASVAPTADATPTAIEILEPTTTPTSRTPGAGETLYRWVNLEILIPDDSGINAGPGGNLYPDSPPRFVIGKVDPEDSRIVSSVVLDSETGNIVEEEVLDQHREDIDRVLTTLRVVPFDLTMAPWPYNGEPTLELARRTEGGLTYIQPSPASGLYMGFGVADPGGSFIDIRNERSMAFIQFRHDGPVYDTSQVHEEDKAVFDRWFASIKQCGEDPACQ